MTSDVFRTSEQLMHSLEEKPYVLFSNQAEKTEKLLKTSLKELNDCLIQNQKKSVNRLQDLYVNQFDEEQLWSQIKSNDNVINSKAENFIASVLANIEEISLFPNQKGDKRQQTNAKKAKERVEEEMWDAGEEEGDEEEDMEMREDGEGMELDGEEEAGMEEDAPEDDVTDEEAERQEFERLEQFLETEDIGLDEDEADAGGNEDDEEGEGMEYMEGGEEDDESEEELGEKKLRKYMLVEEEEDEEDEGKPVRREFDDAEVEDEVFERAREDLLADNDEEEEEERPTKPNAKRSEIDELEEKLLEKKAWQVSGEVQAGQRPLNSLLEEPVDFNITKKGTKKITPEYSGNLEAIIKQRILDEAWDDPIEYALPKPIKETFSNLEELNFEKSKKGLGDIYEDEYKKDVMGIKQATPEDDLKKEIDLLFKKLSFNLDVLSNLSFTPKANLEPTKIVPNVASINLEEKTPLAYSSKHAKAPQELFNPKKAKFEEREELTTEEKRASRRNFKRNIRTRNKEKKKKELIKKLQFKGQTKHEYNLQQKGMSKLKTEVKKKNQKSVPFTKSSQFFDNLEKSKTPKGGKPQAAAEPTGAKKNYML